MKIRDLWKIGVRNIFASPMRSLLTVLGIAIGIGAILAVFTLGEAGRNQVRQEMTRLGIDRVWLSASGEGTLRQGDGAFLQKELGLSATEQVYVPVTVGLGQKTAQGVLLACGQEYPELAGAKLEKGSRLLPAEWKSGSAVLLGQGLAEKLGAEPGNILHILGRGMEVKGIIRFETETSQVDTSMAVLMPIAVFGQISGFGVQEIILSVPEKGMPDTVAAEAKQLMKNRRGVPVAATTMQMQIEAADSVVTVFVDVLKWVALVCILVGGIGVMNILLVSVRERRREIGIMKALGTTPGIICGMFLLEALLYAVVGGIAGVGVGIGIIAVAGNSIGLRTAVKAADCLLVVMAALLVGLAFGVLPACRASAMNPVDALRDE